MSKTSLTDWLKELDLFCAVPKSTPAFDLETTLHHLRHLLPNQGPIKDFIHHNPLHGFQTLGFHEGIDLASHLFGSKKYLSRSFYQAQLSNGAIQEKHLDFVLNLHFSDPDLRANTKQKLLNSQPSSDDRLAGVESWGLRNYWNDKFGVDLLARSAPLIYKLLSSYLDQGISFWPFPSRKDSLWLSLKDLNQQSLFPILPFNKNKIHLTLNQSPESAILTGLGKLIGDQAYFSRYLLETMLCYPGWAGMVCALETNPSTLRKPCSINLMEFLALTLSIESLGVESVVSNESQPLKSIRTFLEEKGAESSFQSESELLQIWHEAFEWSFYEQLLSAIYFNSTSPEDQFSSSPNQWAQAIFCIDDRECSIRRHLESKDSGIETFGTAGFFGIDFWFLAHDELFPLQQSPVTLTPKHLIRSVPKKMNLPPRKKDNILDIVLGGLIKDLVLVPFLSLSALSELFKSVFLKSNRSASSSAINQFESQVILEFKRSEHETKDSRFQLGFTVDEMAERVAKTLRGIGLTQNFAECIYIVAHGASSANNPHFAPQS